MTSSPFQIEYHAKTAGMLRLQVRSSRYWRNHANNLLLPGPLANACNPLVGSSDVDVQQSSLGPARSARFLPEVARSVDRRCPCSRGVKDPRVLKSVGATPRHEFVPPSQKEKAYLDMALPIGERQTISSPYIVAVMTEALDPQPTDRVLEIGTGSGYQAAILSPLVKDVYTIEIVPSLGETATKLLNRLGYKNVHTRIGDGYLGWEEVAPFDKIIVTCSPEKVPQPLQDQLREGGLLIIPVGERYQQTLFLMRKKDGKLEQEALRPTLFVPMTGEAEDNRKVKADPHHPQILNGDFEQELLNHEHVPGWYYQFGLKVHRDDSAPDGPQYVEFISEESGKPALLLQGMPLDGRFVRRIRLSAFVSTVGAKQGQGLRKCRPWLFNFSMRTVAASLTVFSGPSWEIGSGAKNRRNSTCRQQLAKPIVRSECSVQPVQPDLTA